MKSEKRIRRQHDRLMALGTIPPWYRFRKRAAWVREYRSIFTMDVSAMAELLEYVYPLSVVAQRPNPMLRFAKRAP